MIKILAPIVLSILIMSCSSDKEPSTVAQEEITKESSTVDQEKSTKETGELTALDKCLLKVGMQDGSTSSDMSISDVIERELNKMDVDTLKGSDYNGYDHECIDDYIEYAKRVSGNHVADYSDLGDFGSEFIDDIAHDSDRELNICLAHAGINRANSDSKTFEIEESLMGMAANEMMAIDRDTGMGVYLDGFKHECLDLYVDYISKNEVSYTDEDIKPDSAETLEFKIILETVPRALGNGYQTHIHVTSMNDEVITINRVIINRSNTLPCKPMRYEGSSTLGFGQKLKVLPFLDCEANDILEVELITEVGSVTYSF
ncbi:hypothetical protein ACTXIP_01390 [Psychrobacter alimentarius]|uniref:hypothetical protein n=1 Tax=Psychrobacter alimentarius TaxID=261164 RepID=UPI003FCEEEBE